MKPRPPEDECLPDEAHTLIGAELLGSMCAEDLVPAPLAAWRPLVVEALVFFLGRLPPARLGNIVVDQLALPPDAPPEARLVALLSRCPTLHKLGQVLARRHELHPELRRQLQALESMPPGRDLAPITARIRAEIGDGVPLELGDAALAAGSVAVVVPFSWREDGHTRSGVFKVLKPGIEADLAAELAALPELTAFVERRGAELGLPALDYRGTLGSVRRLLELEIRLDIEQANMRHAAEFYRDDPGLFVPELLPWCTPRLTAMERVTGPKVADAKLPAAQRAASRAK